MTEEIRERERERKQVVCPVCSTINGKYFVPINVFKIYKCPNCGLEHTYPMPSLDELKSFYSNYTDIRADSDVVKMNAKRNLQLLRLFGYDNNKSILDFGTGDADFVGVAGTNCNGIDFKSTNKQRVYANLNDLPTTKYDFITLWGVLEHLANPTDTLLQLRDYSKPNGILALTTVDAEGPIPYYYKPVEHLTYWTKLSFEKLFEKAGIKLIEHTPYKMLQRSDIYIDRLISRTPNEYKKAFQSTISGLPEYVEVPTNEIFVIGKFI